MSSLYAELITEIEELERLEEPWRQLAHACACPGALPDWQLAWFRHAAPAGSVLRAIAVFGDDDRLVGLAPFFTVPSGRVDYRLLGAGITHRLAPLALLGTNDEVARLVTETLATARPRPDLIAFEGIDAAASWPKAVAFAWPGLRPWRYTSSTHASPVITLEGGSYESWFAARSASFRKNIREAERRTKRAGARIILAQADNEIEKAIEAFSRLHTARWAHRGGSNLSPESFATLAEAARALVPRDEMRLWALELDGQLIAVQVTFAAGGDVLCFNSGFDESFAKLHPMLLPKIALIKNAFERHERRIDFGAGDEVFKRRFATGDAPITWTGLVPRTHRYPLTRVRLAPDQTRWIATRLVRRLPPKRRKQLKRLLRYRRAPIGT